VSDDVDDGWFYKRPSNSDIKKAGRVFVYSDMAIELCLNMRSVFKLTLRMTQGFLSSLFPKISYDVNQVRCPNYITISRRGGKLSMKLKEVSE
jgi:hypothetical protein